MSYDESLPIYRVALDVCVRIDTMVIHFGRAHKYTLGTRLRDTSTDILLLVARANRKEERVTALVTLCHRVEELKLLLNLGKEVRAFGSFEQFAQIMEQVVGLARQAEGWRAKNPRKDVPEPVTGKPREGSS